MSIYASVQFGSRVRNKTDVFSDNDLLIICSDNERNNPQLASLYEGYNITYFSKSQLDSMKNIGSLFLQHIKKDGQILYDKKNYLKNFLANTKFIIPNHTEIKKCESTISFISKIPNSRLLSFWKADFTYCISRDYLIKKLAQKKILAFGLDEIEIVAIKEFDFSSSEISLFKELRIYKAINRTDEVNYSVQPCERLNFCVKEWLSILMSRMKIKTEYRKRNLLDSLFDREYISTYETLRCLEAIYILVKDKNINHIDHNILMNYIKLPNLYRSLQIKKWGSIKEYIDDMKAFLY